MGWAGFWDDWDGGVLDLTELQVFFTLELIIRFCGFRRKRNCFQDMWFLFDLALHSDFRTGVSSFMLCAETLG